MENYLFKVILGGCAGPTRAEIMSRFTSGKTHSNTRMIIGVDFAMHCINLPENESATLQIWDFGEEHRFRSLIPCFCQGASGAILYFDYANLDTLFELEEWISLIRKQTHNIPILICGTNCVETAELSSNSGDRGTLEDFIHAFIRKHNLKGHFEVNVENGCNVDDSFETLTELMVQLWPDSVLNPQTRIETLLPNQIQP